VIRINRWGVKITLPPVWSGAGSSLFFLVRENYEPETKILHRLLRVGDVFVDGGANCGIFMVAAAGLIGPRGSVYAFEPGRQSFEALQRNVALNGFTHVHLYQCGLGDRDGTARFYHNYGNARNFSLANTDSDTTEYEEIKLMALDSLTKKEGLRALDWIKLDVEGAEELVIRGSVQSLLKFKPRIIFEINPKMTSGLGLSPLGAWDRLRSLGYEFYKLTEKGDTVAITLPEKDKHANLIAIHPKNPLLLTG
jgi:FkbM family methyltransferase